jgi:hypothetical protein
MGSPVVLLAGFASKVKRGKERGKENTYRWGIMETVLPEDLRNVVMGRVGVCMLCVHNSEDRDRGVCTGVH